MIEAIIETEGFEAPEERAVRRLEACCAANCYQYVSLMIKHCKGKYTNVIGTAMNRGDPLGVLLDSDHCDEKWLDLILSVPKIVGKIDSRLLKSSIRKCQRKKLPQVWSDKIRVYMNKT